MEIENLRQRLENLKQLARTSGQEYELKKSLYGCIDEATAVVHHLHPTYVMTRVRVSPSGKSFRKPKELSYPPAGISGLGRANSRGRALFYASSCERRKVGYPSKYEQITDPRYGLSIALFETLFELRKNAFTSAEPQVVGDEEEKMFHVSKGVKLELTDVSYGYWQAVETLNLIKVAPLRQYDHDVFDAFMNYNILTSSVHDPRQVMDNVELWEFLGPEFAKLGIKEGDPIDYRISSIAAEKFIKDGYDGVSYPSVRSGGWGINFAISPSAVDRKLRCFRVNRALVRAESGELVVKEIESQRIDPFDQNAPF